MKMTGPFVGTHKNRNPGPGHYKSFSTLNKLCFSLAGKNLKVDK